MGWVHWIDSLEITAHTSLHLSISFNHRIHIDYDSIGCTRPCICPSQFAEGETRGTTEEGQGEESRERLDGTFILASISSMLSLSMMLWHYAMQRIMYHAFLFMEDNVLPTFSLRGKGPLRYWSRMSGFSCAFCIVFPFISTPR